MRRGLMAVTAAALLVAAVGVAAAQGPGGGGGGGRRFGQGRMGGGMMGGGLALLRIPEVQQELKMTQPQIDKIEPKQQEVQQASRQMSQEAGNFQSMSQEDRQKLFAKMQELQLKAVSDILDTKQLTRFKQLELQRLGPAAVLRKDVSDALKLTPEQRTKIQGIQQAQMDEMRNMFQGGGQGGDRQAMMTKMRDLQKATGDKIVAALTPEQQKQWKGMLGETFKFPEPQRGGGRPPQPNP